MGSGVAQVGIVSTGDDIHALAIAQVLRDELDTPTALIAADQVSAAAGLTWGSSQGDPVVVPTENGPVSPGDLDAIWWRRISFPQKLPDTIHDQGHVALIESDCRTALQGALATDFEGRWVSDPWATAAAENKLVQLRVAQAVGLRVPKTVVTQTLSVVSEFRDSLQGNVIVKAVRGTRHAPALTSMLRREHLASETSVGICPAMYQEYIAGRKHLRVCVFGDVIVAFELQSEDLDWRGDLNIPIAAVGVPEAVARKLRAVLEVLRLRMGVFDLKVVDGEEPVFLEVNPQGQFLFLEGLSGVDVMRPCARFLRDEALRSLKGDPRR